MQLTATDVTKVIKGKTVLSHINLSLNSGYVYGFIGPNASGKTMLFRALSGLMSVTAGVVSLDGKFSKRTSLFSLTWGFYLKMFCFIQS